MKISKQQLKSMKACEDGLERFIEQTNNTEKHVEVLSLIGGKNTVGDLIWLAEGTLSKEKLVRFTCDLALINIEKIKLYTEKYDLIVEFLMNPTATRVADSDEVHVALRTADALHAARAADALHSARVAADDARTADALHAALHADAVYADRVADRVAVYAVHAVDAAVRAGATQDQINTLLVKMFED